MEKLSQKILAECSEALKLDMDKKRSVAAVEEIKNMGEPVEPGSGTYLIGRCLIKLVPLIGNEVYFEHISSLDPSKGNASVVLDKILKVTDKYKVLVKLNAKKTDPGGLTDSQLRKWYTRHGFAPHKIIKGMMVHSPSE